MKIIKLLLFISFASLNSIVVLPKDKQYLGERLLHAVNSCDFKMFKLLCTKRDTLDIKIDGENILLKALKSLSREKEDSINIVKHVLGFLKNGDPVITMHGNKDVVPLKVATEKNITEIVQALIQKGADATIPDSFGITPLMCAARNGNYYLFSLLYVNYGDVDDADDNDKTVLMHAVIGGSVKIVEFILRNSTQYIDLRDNRGRTALLIAADLAKLEIIKLLHKNGADLAAFDYYGNGILFGASKNENKEDNLNMIKYALDHDVNFYHKNVFNETPLFNAVRIGDIDMFKELFSRSDLSESDILDCLILAAAHNKTEFLNYILDSNKIDINSCGAKHGRTVLLLAACYGNLEMVKLLVDRLSSLHSRSYEGLAPYLTYKDFYGYGILHYAASSGNTELVSYLLELLSEINIADTINQVNGDFQTPLDIANIVGDKPMYDLLKSRGAVSFQITGLSERFPVFVERPSKRTHVF